MKSEAEPHNDEARQGQNVHPEEDVFGEHCAALRFLGPAARAGPYLRYRGSGALAEVVGDGHRSKPFRSARMPSRVAVDLIGTGK
jgi:hypothetical protein